MESILNPLRRTLRGMRGLTVTSGSPPPSGAIQVGSSGQTPDAGQGPSLNGWSWASMAAKDPWWAEFFRDVTGDAVSPYNAAMQTLFANAPNNKLVTSWYGDSYHNPGQGNPLYGVPYNHIRGDCPMSAVGTIVYQNPGIDPTTFPYQGGLSIEAWPFPFSAVTVANGSAVVTGSGTHFNTPTSNTYVYPGGTYVFGVTSPPVYYTVASVQSDTQFTLTAPYVGSSGTLQMWGPFNLPPTSASATAVGSDMHMLSLQRDESTGLPRYLWEMYDVSSQNSGATLNCASLAKWDLGTGAPLMDGAAVITAASIPMLPWLVTYDKCVNGNLNHALRGILGTAMGCGGYVFPARASNNSPQTTYTTGHVPLGGRLRLNASWYNSNKASFAASVRPVVDALYRYGMINADWTSPGYSLWIDGADDGRWAYGDVAQLRNIPVTAFELIDTVKPQLSLTGPGSLSVGVPATFTLTYLYDSVNTAYNCNYYFYYAINGGSAVNFGSSTYTHGSGTHTATFTPPSSGNYSITVSSGSSYWLLPPALNYTI
jgi:hypothetical protein